MSLEGPTCGAPYPRQGEEGRPAHRIHWVMQILSRLIVTFGIIILIAAALLLGKDVIDINQLHAVAYANKSNEGPSPVNNVMITAGLAALGGLLTGLGVTLPARRPRVRTPH